MVDSLPIAIGINKIGFYQKNIIRVNVSQDFKTLFIKNYPYPLNLNPASDKHTL